ncbi:helix-turn-helix domain-containing protein [Gorillibacterium sp. sgz5001074]|uniref:helix-turn-helix domain-containing protein n=1 Tax=Gorillibacterium sp. sgz5001074 TaxID=3446695 RepID=UPI003F66B6D1
MEAYRTARRDGKEHTEIPDWTFPIHVFHLAGSHSRIIPPHWHDHLEWIAVTQGGFRVQVDSAFQDLHAGEAAFVNTQQLHSAFPLGETSELYAVVFNEALLHNYAMDSTESKYILPLLQGQEPLIPSFYSTGDPVTRKIHHLLEELCASYQERGPGYELLVKSSLLGLLGMAFRHADSSQSVPRKHRGEHIIQPLLVHLADHFHEPLSVNQAALLCCVSPQHFCAVFKKATGKTLIEYIHMLRIHRAEQLLRAQHHSIQEIGHLVGYSNPTYFGRMFKRFKRMTPKEYARHPSSNASLT